MSASQKPSIKTDKPLVVGLASIFVTLNGQRVVADARPDLGREIFATFVEEEGEEVPRYFRVERSEEWPNVIDITEEIEGRLIARQRRTEERLQRERDEAMSRLQRAANQTPTTIRRDDDAVTDEWSETAGVKRLRIRTPLQRLHAKRLLTGRQFSAGQALHEDHLLAMMVRQPAEVGGGGGFENGGGTACFETAAIEASTRITKARIRCDRQDTGIWPVVWAVAIKEATVSGLAGSDRSRDTAPYMLALRSGLDVIGDCYGLPSDYTRTEVRVGHISVLMEIAEDHENLWRARSLNGRPWLAEGKTAGEVYTQARTEMRERVFRRLGFGPYRDSDIAMAVDADREAAKAARTRRIEAEEAQRKLAATEATTERERVVRR